MAAAASPAKLKSGNWGARVPYAVKPGDRITIVAQNGRSWQSVVERVVWSGDGVWLVSTVDAKAAGAPASSERRPEPFKRRGGYSRPTGCKCGSRQDDNGDLIESPRNCAHCRLD